MDKKDIERVLGGREIVDKHRNRNHTFASAEEQGDSTKEMYAGLEALGFKSFQEFETNSELANFDEWKAKTQIVGECDKCKGYEGTPPCVLRHADHACFYTPMTTDDIYKQVYKWRRIDGERSNVSSGEIAEARKAFVNKNGIYRGCPEGHGWKFIDFDKRVFDFDIDWKIK